MSRRRLGGHHLAAVLGACAAVFSGLSWTATHGVPPEPLSDGRIVVDRSTWVSAEAPAHPHAETYLAINPRNASEMLAAAIKYVDGRSTAAVYASNDGGVTWTRSAAARAITSLDGGDPLLLFNDNGTALFGAIAGHPDGFRIWRSTDAGRSWTSVTRVPGGVYDRPYMGIDRSAGLNRGRVYVAGIVSMRRGPTQTGAGPVIATTFTDDGGLTFSPTVSIDPAAAPAAGGEGGLWGIADVIVNRRGEVIVPFRNGPRLATTISTDAGKSFSAVRPGPRIGHGSGYRAVKTLGSVRAVMDTSSRLFRDRLYVSWIDFAENRYDVKVTYSDDAGQTWSPPVRVNDNTGPNDPANPSIAVNDDGVVFVTFNDRRDDPKNDCYRLYASASLDGGETFLPNVRVKDAPTCTQAPGNWPGLVFTRRSRDQETQRHVQIVQLSGVPERFPNGGETMGLVAGPDGRFHAAWINGESGVMQIWYTAFQVQGRPTRRAGRDYTTDVELLARAPIVDFDARSIRFVMTLRNQSAEIISGPLLLRLDDLDGALNGLMASNSDNGQRHAGAMWRFDVRTLAPGECSAERELRFGFDGVIPPEPDAKGRFLGQFRVLQERLD